MKISIDIEVPVRHDRKPSEQADAVTREVEHIAAQYGGMIVSADWDA